MTVISLISLTLLSAAAVLYYVTRTRDKRVPLPPGPSPLPIIGNLLDLPKERHWLKYREWSQQYGSDMLFLSLPRQPTIILNSYQAVSDLFDKRSRLYSDRPPGIMDVLTGWDWNMALKPYGADWRAARREFHQYFNERAISAYEDVASREVRGFLRRLSQRTEKLDIVSISETFAAIILDITYGMRDQDDIDRYVTLARYAVKAANVIKLPGLFWVEYFPWLRYIPGWVPGSTARKFADPYKPAALKVRSDGCDIVKSTPDDIATPCIAKELIHKLRKYPLGTDEYFAYEEIIKDVTGIAYAAAVDTQASALFTFFLIMTEAPTVQRRAQEQLNTVVGPDRLPTKDDLNSLPFIRAIFMETIRFNPVIPLGVTRRVAEDDEYMGYLIPRGTSVVPNVWGILHDPVNYPEPDVFNPDRFLRDGALDPDVLDPTAIAFGFGRRVCPGRYFAAEALQLIIASVLHVFTIEAVEPAGTATEKLASGILALPEQIPGRLKPRNAAALALVQAES